MYVTVKSVRRRHILAIVRVEKELPRLGVWNELNKVGVATNRHHVASLVSKYRHRKWVSCSNISGAAPKHQSIYRVDAIHVAKRSEHCRAVVL